MKENLDDAIEEVLRHEGGYVNHPHDPGGATNQGITKKTYEHYLERKVSIEEIQNIPIEHVKAIYTKNYWGAVKGDDLPSGVDFAVFDWSVNSGPRRAIKGLQKVVGATTELSTFKTFGRGWIRRNNETKTYALSLAES